jgi:hypothetical protein
VPSGVLERSAFISVYSNALLWLPWAAIKVSCVIWSLYTDILVKLRCKNSPPSDLGLASFQALIDGDFVLYLVFSKEQSMSHEVVPGYENDLAVSSLTAKWNCLLNQH